MKYTVLTKVGFVLVAVGMAACVTEAELEPADDLLFFVQKPVEGERVVMDALYQGSVIERDGCLRLGDEPDSHTVVWPPGFSLVRSAGDQVVLNEAGRSIGSIGGFFRLGGGEVTTLWEDGPVDDATRTAALDRCPGRYWLVGDVVAP